MANELIFKHESISRPLVIDIKPDQITWSYGLNTKSYPTFGGEVVQILSMYVGDMTISGTVRTYEQMEIIYKWFIEYMQNATQGRSSISRQYDTRPVTVEYPHRNWKFDIYPRDLPGFQYGKDVVAPTWQVIAAVSEYNDAVRDSVLSEQMFAGEALADGFDPFGTASGYIGYEENNPWSAPNTNKTLRDEETKKMEDHLINLIPSYLDGSFKDLESSYSKPALSTPKDQQNDPNKKEKGASGTQSQRDRVKKKAGDEIKNVIPPNDNQRIG